MMTKTRKLSLAAISSALGVVLLYLTAVMPTGGLALAAAAGILPCVVFLQCGVGYSVMHYAVTCLLSLLLVPDKSFVLWYVFAFGHYGICKLLIEKLGSRILRWGLKLATCAASIGLMFGLFSGVFLGTLPDFPLIWLFVVLLVVFMLYDAGLTGVLRAYSVRIAPYFNK